MSRFVVRRGDWDATYYHSPQRTGQRKADSSDDETRRRLAWTMRRLRELGFVDDDRFDWARFLDYRERVHENFFNFWTAINPPVEALLYAISWVVRPRRVLGVGVHTGNPIAWSLGPALDGVYEADWLAGVEIDPNCARLAKMNFDQISPGRVEVLAEDGFDVLERLQPVSLDLLYLDAAGYDPPARSKISRGRAGGKNVNYLLLKVAVEKMKPGGVVLCHNAYQPSFQRQAADYLAFTSDERFFERTATLGIDEMGLEFSIVAG
ncbi:MAG: hypothetical protein Kow0069_04970 [Promethearchaeota archaeon]